MNKKPNTIKPILLTERDKVVLSKIADYQILNTEQIYRLCFPSLSRARKRLLQLCQHGYLKRMVKPIRMGEGSSMFLYFPARRGLQLISGDATRKQARKRPSSIRTEHTLAINTFRICLELATSKSKVIILDSWKEGRGLMMKAGIKDKGIIKQIPIIPDAYFTLKLDERIFQYFLEIDRGTTDLKRVTLKCRGYLNIWEEKTAHAKFDIRSFRVLFVTTSEKRLSNILEQLRKLQSHHHRLDLILMTDAEVYSLAKPDRIFEPIWKTLSTDGRIQNVCLLPSSSLRSSRQREENHHCAVQNPIPVNGNPGPGG